MNLCTFFDAFKPQELEDLGHKKRKSEGQSPNLGLTSDRKSR